MLVPRIQPILWIVKEMLQTINASIKVLPYPTAQAVPLQFFFSRMSRHRCQHFWQSRDGTSQSQTMIKCRDCNQLLAQVYRGCEPDLLATVPEVREMLELQKARLEEKIEELKKDLKETTVALEDLSDAHQELEAQLEWLKVPDVKHEQTQTEQNQPSSSSGTQA